MVVRSTATSSRQADRRFTRLLVAMERDRRALQPFRERRLQCAQAYAGSQYGKSVGIPEQPVGLMGLFCKAMVRNLVGGSPRFQLSTWVKQAEPAVKAAEAWGNKEAERQRLDLVFQSACLEALFCLGVVKVGLATPSDAALGGWGIPAGVAFVEAVNFDDWVCDTNASRWDQLAYEGHRLRVPLESVTENKMYLASAREQLAETAFSRTNDGGDDKASSLGSEDEGAYEEVDEMVDLWSVYLPREKRQLTLAATEGGGVPGGDRRTTLLRDVEWYGPPDGPYHHLALGPPPPGNLIPQAPAMNLVYLHRVLNDIMRKLIGQAYRQKTNTLGRTGAADDAERLRRARDGEYLLVGNPDDHVEISRGGPSAQNFQLFDYLRNLFDQLAGNLSTLLGLRPLAGTAKQEGILNANASGTLADMQESVAAFVSRVCRAWLWWEWNSPVRRMSTRVAAPQGLARFDVVQTNYPNTARFRADPRTRDMVRAQRFDGLDVRIDPYSLQFTTPAQRANELTQTLVQVIAPMMGLLQQQGMGPDMNYFLETYGKYKDMPELAKLMQLVEPPEDVAARGGAGREGAGMPAATSREYVRRSEGSGEEGVNGEMNNHVSAMAAAEASRNGKPAGGVG